MKCAEFSLVIIMFMFLIKSNKLNCFSPIFQVSNNTVSDSKSILNVSLYDFYGYDKLQDIVP